MLEGSSVGREQAAHAQAEQPDARLVNLGAGHDPVQHRGDDVLPIRPEDEAIEVASGGMARPVEREHVVAAFRSCGGAVVVHFLCGAVKAVVQDHRRACRVVALAAGGAIKVAVQDGVLVGDLHHLDRGSAQRRGVLKALRGAAIGVVDARIGGVAMQEELGSPVVVARSHQPVAGAGAMPGGKLVLRFGGDPVGGGQPLVVPAVIVAGDDVLCRREDFADVGPAVGGVTQGAQGLEPKLRVIGEQDRCQRFLLSRYNST